MLTLAWDHASHRGWQAQRTLVASTTSRLGIQHIRCSCHTQEFPGRKMPSHTAPRKWLVPLVISPNTYLGNGKTDQSTLREQKVHLPGLEVAPLFPSLHYCQWPLVLKPHSSSLGKQPSPACLVETHPQHWQVCPTIHIP